MMRQLGDLAADRVDLRLGHNRLRVHLAAAIHLFQIFARQIQPTHRRILIDIAQDVGELQRPAQMMRQLESGPFVHPKHFDGKTSHRTGHPVAIEIESGKVRRDNVFRHVHVHAVQHGKEILKPQAIMRDGGRQEAYLLRDFGDDIVPV